LVKDQVVVEAVAAVPVDQVDHLVDPQVVDSE
jgi:hypothetical protein